MTILAQGIIFRVKFHSEKMIRAQMWDSCRLNYCSNVQIFTKYFQFILKFVRLKLPQLETIFPLKP